MRHVSRSVTNGNVSEENLWICMRCYALAVSWIHNAALELPAFFVEEVAAPRMSQGSASICVNVDDTARLDNPDQDKQSLLNFTFIHDLLTVAMQVLFSMMQFLCKDTNGLWCAAITSCMFAYSQRLKHSF